MRHSILKNMRLRTIWRICRYGTDDNGKKQLRHPYYQGLYVVCPQELYEAVDSSVHVGRDDVCEQWEMSETMKAAGRSAGKIKRREYLIYLASVRADEEIARQLRVNYPYKSIEAIRSEFEKEHGSIYFNL